MNKNKLKSKIVENGMTQKILAETLCLSQHTLNAKINNRLSFNIEEVMKIAYILKLQNPADIFFED